MFSAITKGLRDVRILEGTSLPAIPVVPGFFYRQDLERLYFQSPNEDANLDLTGLSGLDGGNTFKNAVINGDMRIWQRGTSFAAVSSGNYTVDRYWYGNGGSTAVHTISRSTDIPNNQFQYSTKLDCTTADASVDAGDNVGFYQKIEGYNFRKFVGQQATLSFWVKAGKTGTMCVSFRNSAADRSYVSEVTIDTADTWEKKTITLDFNYSGGTWDYTNGKGIGIGFNLMCGSTYQTTADAWQSGNYLATSNQTNFCDNADTTCDVYITGVQLELGPEDTAFEFLDQQTEFAQCQRYYRIGRRFSGTGGRTITNGTLAFAHFEPYPVEMRTTPTVSATFSYSNLKSGTADAYGNKGIYFRAQGTGSGTNHWLTVNPWTADAEL